MKIKNIVALLLALLAALCLAACSDNDESNDKKPNSAVDEVSDEENSEEESSEEESSFLGADELKDLSQYISLGIYDGIQMADKAVLTDEIVEAVLNLNYLSDYATLHDVGKDRAAKMDDTVVIDFVGYYVDSGEQIEGSSSEDKSLVLGSGTFIDGFEEAIVGRFAGEEFEVLLTYPEDYHYKEYAGVEARFVITLDSVQETLYPESTEEIAAELGFDSLELMLEEVRAEAEQDVYDQNVSDVWEAVINGCTVIQYPEDLVAAYAKQYSDYYLSYYEYYSTYAGVELEDYVSTVLGLSLDDFKADLNKTADEYGRGVVKEELIMYAILDEVFGREITDKEYNTMLSEAAEEYGKTAEEIEEAYGEEALRINMYWEKVMLYVYENAVFGAVNE